MPTPDLHVAQPIAPPPAAPAAVPAQSLGLPSLLDANPQLTAAVAGAAVYWGLTAKTKTPTHWGAIVLAAYYLATRVLGFGLPR